MRARSVPFSSSSSAKNWYPGNYHDVTLAINRFLRTSLNTVLVAGFWQGEIGPNAFGQTQFGVIVFTLDSIGG